MPNPNLEVVRMTYDALGRGDIPAVLGVMDPAIEWREAEGFPYGGVYHGPEEVLEEVFVRLVVEWEEFEVAPARYIDGGETVVALGEYSGTFKETGRSFRAPFAHVWWLEAGRAVRFQQFTDTALARDALM